MLGSSSLRRSTPERKKHSISFGIRTGRPLSVSFTGGKEFPVIVEDRKFDVVLKVFVLVGVKPK